MPVNTLTVLVSLVYINQLILFTVVETGHLIVTGDPLCGKTTLLIAPIWTPSKNHNDFENRIVSYKVAPNE